MKRALLCLLLLIVPYPALAAVARVGTPVTATFENSANTALSTGSKVVTTGNTIVVTTVIYSPASEVVTSITDTAGNTYIGLTACENSGTDRYQTWYAVNVTGGTLTFTSHYTSTLYSTIVASEYSGVSAFDTAIPCTTGTGTAVASSTFTSTGAGLLYTAGVSANSSSTMTPAATYKALTSGFYTGRGYTADWVTSSAQILSSAALTQTISSAWLVGGAAFLATTSGPTVITTSDNAVSVVAAGYAGTTYSFACPGVTTGCTHRIANKLVPRVGDTLTTPQAAILSGAITLPSTVGLGSDWTLVSGIWRMAQTARSPDHAHTGTSVDCDAGIDRCEYPEDLFRDGVEKRHVTSTGAVTAGTFFYDYAANLLYVGDNPSGHVMELSIAENAVKASVNSVTIEKLTIEKFATNVQTGAIEPGGTDWVLRNTEVRYNHARGTSLGTRMWLHDNYIHHNFEEGVAGIGDNVLFEKNELAYNRSAVVGFARGFEAGGSKFAFTNYLIVRLNNVHHNDGVGLWTDISNRHCEISGNTVDDNGWSGIMHEISFDCIIRDNIIRRNGLLHPDVALGGKQCFVTDAGIFIAASANVQVYGNYLEGNADSICAMQQDRSSNESGFSEATGSYRVRGLSVHDNVIAGSGASGGHMGLSADTFATEVVDLTGTYAGGSDPVEVRQPAGTGYNNHFECNRYYVGAGTSGLFWWDWVGGYLFADWQALGHDTGSAVRCVATNGTVGSYASFASYTAFTPPARRPRIRKNFR